MVAEQQKPRQVWAIAGVRLRTPPSGRENSEPRRISGPLSAQVGPRCRVLSWKEVWFWRALYRRAGGGVLSARGWDVLWCRTRTNLGQLGKSRLFGKPDRRPKRRRSAKSKRMRPLVGSSGASLLRVRGPSSSHPDLPCPALFAVAFRTRARSPKLPVAAGSARRHAGQRPSVSAKPNRSQRPHDLTRPLTLELAPFPLG